MRTLLRRFRRATETQRTALRNWLSQTRRRTFRHLTVIGVTGSSGKSTTVGLLRAILSEVHPVATTRQANGLNRPARRLRLLRQPLKVRTEPARLGGCLALPARHAISPLAEPLHLAARALSRAPAAAELALQVEPGLGHRPAPGLEVQVVVPAVEDGAQVVGLLDGAGELAAAARQQRLEGGLRRGGGGFEIRWHLRDELEHHAHRAAGLQILDDLLRRERRKQ